MTFLWDKNHSFIQALLRETVSFVAFWCFLVLVQQSFSFLSSLAWLPQQFPPLAAWRDFPESQLPSTRYLGTWNLQCRLLLVQREVLRPCSFVAEQFVLENRLKFNLLNVIKCYIRKRLIETPWSELELNELKLRTYSNAQESSRRRVSPGSLCGINQAWISYSLPSTNARELLFCPSPCRRAVARGTDICP